MKKTIIAILGIGILFSVSLVAQTEWEKYSGNPVLDVGPSGSWDDNFIYENWVILENGTFKMWYSGHDGGVFSIGYATSHDGVNWTKYDENPVVEDGPSGACDSRWATNPSVMFDDGIYKMWYAGWDGNFERICYAVSDDGLSWTKVDSLNPILDVGDSGSWDDFAVATPVVIRIDTTYFMWYGGYDGTNARIGLATSSDGMHWEKEGTNPVMALGTGWESRHMWPETVIYNGSSFQMWYIGSNAAYVIRTGYAVSVDGINWTKDTSNPVLDIGPSGAWDHSTAAAGSVVFDGTHYHMWYENSQLTSFGAIGYAYSPVDVAVEDNTSTIPSSFALHQNHPNPFNPGTALRYDLPERTEVRLTVYDLLGREIRTLIHAVQEPGSRTVTWDGTNNLGQQMSAGVYLYRVQTGDFAQTRKMILLR